MPHKSYIGPDGKVWPSATELTSLLPQPWIMAWYKSQVKAHGWRGWLKCLATSQRGMRIGTEVHGLIEGFIKKEPFQISGKYESEIVADALFDAVNPKVKEWIALEPHLGLPPIQIHGTADAIVLWEDGIPTVLDWKTSAEESDTHPIQLAIYAMCWNYMGTPRVNRGIIARVNKKSKRLKVKLDIYDNLYKYYKIVLALRTIWGYTHGEE